MTNPTPDPLFEQFNSEEGRKATKHMRRYARFAYWSEAMFLILFLAPIVAVGFCVLGAIASAL